MHGARTVTRATCGKVVVIHTSCYSKNQFGINVFMMKKDYHCVNIILSLFHIKTLKRRCRAKQSR